MFLSVTHSANCNQVVVTLPPQPLVAQVMHVKRRASPALLALPASPPQDALTQALPMRQAQVEAV